ncbi:MAG TPA: ferric reductase-like transmembrane domain-containing protein [Acidimicrobiales bacterium]|nr:ferric reductase-like transmembrane domain-containing protein [Acidimicrobiales bacterium]
MSVPLFATSGPELWYLTRATGIVTLVLLTVSVALGIAAGGNWERPNWPRFLTQGLHRNTSLLSVVFLFLHVMTTVVDSYVPVGWANAVVPFTSPYHRFWLGLGAVTCDLLLALVATSLLRRHIRHGTWRGVHWLAYVSWPVALLHGLGMGTDRTTSVLRLIAASCTVVVFAAVVWRVGRRATVRVALRVPALAAALLVTATAAFALEGGFRPAAPPQQQATAPPPAPTTASPPAAPGGAPTPAAPALPATEVPDQHAATAQVVSVGGSGPVTTAPPATVSTVAAPDDSTEKAPAPTTTTTRPPAPTTTAPPPTTTTTAPPPPPTTTTTRPPTTTTTQPCRYMFGCDGGGGDR